MTCRKNTTVPTGHFLGMGATCLLVALLAGVGAAVLYAWPGGRMPTHLFPLVRRAHVGLVLGWVYMASLGVIAHEIGSRAKYPLALRASIWVSAILAVLMTGSILVGWTSGREYLIQPVIFSPGILLVWSLVFVNFLAHLREFPKPRPIWLWMWLAGFLLFFCAFLEAHAFLLPGVRSTVIRDMAIQWKAYGTLIGSWNMLVYGAALWTGDRLRNGPRERPGRLPWALFGVALVNSLTNFAHHTYHLPMSLPVRQFSFVVSMAETFILAKVLFDLVISMAVRSGNEEENVAISRLFLSAAGLWNGLNLILALAISIPIVNGLTHGTYVTVAHSMGSMIGINTFILFAATARVLVERSGGGCVMVPNRCRALFVVANLSLAVFLGSLFRLGIERGLAHLEGRWSVEADRASSGGWIALLVASGAVLAVSLGWFAARFVRAAWRTRDRSGATRRSDGLEDIETHNHFE